MSPSQLENKHRGMEIWKTWPRSVCVVQGLPAGLSSWNLPRCPPGAGVSSPHHRSRTPSSGGSLTCLHMEKVFRPLEISQLDSRKTVNGRRPRGDFLVPEGISAPGGASALLVLALLEVCSCIGGVCRLVINNLGFCQGGVRSQRGRPECLYGQSGIYLTKVNDVTA